MGYTVAQHKAALNVALDLAQRNPNLTDEDRECLVGCRMVLEGEGVEPRLLRNAERKAQRWKTDARRAWREVHYLMHGTYPAEED